MTPKQAIWAMIVLSSALASAPAAAHGVRFGIGFGFPVFPPDYYYPPYYYPPPAYYYPPQVVSVPAPAPPVYVERGDAQASAASAESYWYFCPTSKTYYPYVRDCAEQWQRVSPRPPGM